MWLQWIRSCYQADAQVGDVANVIHASIQAQDLLDAGLVDPTRINKWLFLEVRNQATNQSSA